MIVVIFEVTLTLNQSVSVGVFVEKWFDHIILPKMKLALPVV